MSNIRKFQFKRAQNLNFPNYLPNKIDVQIKEIYSTEYSNFVWPSAILMCEFVCSNYEIFQSKNLIELGSGTGIVAIVASKIGSNVFLTDMFQKEQSLGLCQENIRLNGVDINVYPIEWGNIPMFKSIPKVDCIIGSDCFYDELDFEDILCSASLLLNSSIDVKKASFYIAYQLRSSIHSVECLAKKWNLSCRLIPFKSKMQDCRQVIEIYEIKNAYTM